MFLRVWFFHVFSRFSFHVLIFPERDLGEEEWADFLTSFEIIRHPSSKF